MFILSTTHHFRTLKFVKFFHCDERGDVRDRGLPGSGGPNARVRMLRISVWVLRRRGGGGGGGDGAARYAGLVWVIMRQCRRCL